MVLVVNLVKSVVTSTTTGHVNIYEKYLVQKVFINKLVKSVVCSALF